MKIFFRNMGLAKNKLLLNVIQFKFSSSNQLPAAPKNSKSKGSAKPNVKNSSPKKAKKQTKRALEEIIEEEATEVPQVPVKAVSKSSKGKKGKKAKTANENITEQENIKTNVRKKSSKKKEETIKEVTQASETKISIENMKLGNQYSDSPINYMLKCDKSSENPYEDYIQNRSSMVAKSYILNERIFTCYNYAPLPVVLEKGNGIFVQDVDNNFYVDFLSGYSSLNFGHCNSEILDPVVPQMSQLHMTSRAFHNTLIGNVSKILAHLFDMDKVLFMNSGVEAGESAVKFARRWGYKVKKIEENQAEVVFFSGNFWGRTIAACGSSDDKSRTSNFGPYGGLGFHIVPYNNIQKLEEILQQRPNICAIMLEPIQGEAGIIIPQEDYLLKVRELCTKYNVLMIVDEIQTALGRGAGNTTVCRSKNVKPDLLLLGKSLSGGFYPVSAVVGKNEVMDLIRPGEHGSTYGGNPLALRFVYSVLNYIANGKCILEVNDKEGIFSTYLKFQNKFIKEIRGRGMMFGIEIFEDSPISAHEISLYLMERGILCKPTKSNILRLSPPIIISENELYKCCGIIRNVFKQLEKLYPHYVPAEKTKFNFPILSPEAAKIVTNRINSENANRQHTQTNENLNLEVNNTTSEVKNPETISHTSTSETTTNENVNTMTNANLNSTSASETTYNQNVNTMTNANLNSTITSGPITNENVNTMTNANLNSTITSGPITNENVNTMTNANQNSSVVNNEMNALDMDIPEIERLINEAIEHTNLKNYTKLKV